MAMYNDSDSEELDDYEILRLERWDEIKHFSISDYLSCKETNDILKQEWSNEYENTEKVLEDIFVDYHTYFNDKGYNLLALADKIHQSDFISLITHHIKKKYNIGIFEEEPSLAKPLVLQIEKIKEQREEQRRKQLVEKYKSASKTFDWNTKKYV